MVWRRLPFHSDDLPDMKPIATPQFTRNHSHLVLIAVEARKIIRYAPVQAQRQPHS